MSNMNLNESPLIQVTDSGLYCEQGGFFIDPWRPVDRAVVTHAHGDHLHWGCGRYLVAAEGLTVTRARLRTDAIIDTARYGQPVEINGVRVSFHPAGHILGSAQVRLEHRGRVWVASGDYKTESDPTCAPFEPVTCHLFISECTFGLPIYRWPSGTSVMADVFEWWQGNRAAGRASLLYAYALGKAQRLLSGIAAAATRAGGLPGPIFTHGAVEPLNRAYREAGVELPPTTYASEAPKGTDWSSSLVLAPPSAHGTPWTRRFGASSSAFASGWMRIRGTRRRRAVDRGFVLSDHADWPGLLAAIDATGAETIWLTHGYTAPLTRWLRDHGKNAHALATRYEGETDREETADASESTAGASGETTTTEQPTLFLPAPDVANPES
jgi:putative mRNA 3-end processing factor